MARQNLVQLLLICMPVWLLVYLLGFPVLGLTYYILGNELLVVLLTMYYDSTVVMYYYTGPLVE